MATMSPGYLGTIVTLSFMVVLTIRPLLRKRLVLEAALEDQARRAFELDLALCLVAGGLMSLHNTLMLDVPHTNTISLILGSIIAGFFIGLDASLRQEREIIMAAMHRGSPVVLKKKLFSLTRKFTVAAVTTFLFISVVLVLVFVQDVAWLLDSSNTGLDMQQAQLAVTIEIFFIMLVLILLVINLIVHYSRNLKLLFTSLTTVLEKVSDGDLSSKVAVATHDEFGVIANHTNQMIDGLRHRFRLLSGLELAKEVQQNLLPHTSPLSAYFDINAISIYCEQTGGDYYDYLLFADKKMGIVVADACGHGVGAALLISSVRAFTKAAAAAYINPTVFLREINRNVTADCAQSSRFTSMFFLELDANRLQWIRAGHEPPILYRQADKSVTLLDKGELVLGIDPDLSYQKVESLAMAEGDILVITTDGVKEARGADGELYGEKRLTEVIKKHAPAKAHQIRQAIVSDIDSFRDGVPLADDLTLVVIKALSPTRP